MALSGPDGVTVLPVRHRGGVSEVHCQGGWRPTGWSRPARDAAQLLAEARRCALERGAGAVGVEHLAMALLEKDLGRLTERLRTRLAKGAAQLDRPWLGLLRHADGAVDDTGTLSLQALGWGLAENFRVAELVAALEREEDSAVYLARRVVSREANQTLIPAGSLRVLGGPECGRVLQVVAQDRVGVEQGLQHQLYKTTWLTDPSVLGRGLTWLGWGQALLPPGAVLISGPDRLERPGRHRVFSQDIIALSDTTWLVGMP